VGVIAKSAGARIVLLVIAITGVALLLGYRFGPHATPAASVHSAQVDTAVTGFRALIDRDMLAINSPFDKSSKCRTRQVCAAELTETRSASEGMLVDLASASTPKVFVQADAAMTIAARQFIAQLDAALTLLLQPNSDYLAASGIPRSYNLRLAVAAVDCWPGKPLPADQTYFLPDNGGIPCQ
jgi:hypothetical protein